ncbi:glycosyltransferase family 4 protein [Photobacterium leiognathi]|uniref:glycosyltransferase family 4 protein n=1 Tax=Photobacterium leiognathi TaxID=553611 RepID=UPI002982A8F1|nr:glycosyltransferase family 4 protein [Photobacterium leiognathi]
MNRFATIFNGFENVHLTKDVGMIPAAFSKKKGFNKSIIYYWDKTGNKSSEEQPLLITKPIYSKYRFFYFLKLMQEIKKDNISIINVYHDSIQTALLLIVFKVLNIKTYLKLDMDRISYKALFARYKSKSIIDRLRLYGLKKATTVSVETYEIYNKLDNDKTFSNKLIRIPNAILIDTISTKPLIYDKRKNTIVVVGRIGAYPKNHELILNTLSAIDNIGDWEINFIGPICEEFVQKIDNFYAKNVRYKNNVKFLGSKNRDEMSSIYAKSKVFLLSSLSEGFSLALVEACYFGCYILSTDVGGAYEVTNKAKYGYIYKPEDLKLVLSNLDDDKIKDSYCERLSFGESEFNIEKYIEKLTGRLLE